MAFSTFGITSAVVQSDFLPQYTIDANSTPATARVTELINRRAARISGLVDALGLDASSLDSTDEPIAFYFCQRLVGCGAAVDVYKAFTGKKVADGPAEAWRDEWEEGLETLSGPGAKAALKDALGSSSPLLMRSHVQHGNQTPSGSGDVAVEDPIATHMMDL